MLNFILGKLAARIRGSFVPILEYYSLSAVGIDPWGEGRSLYYRTLLTGMCVPLVYMKVF